MKFRDIAIKNINKRKAKMGLVVAGLGVAVATAVAILSIVLSFGQSVSAELDRYGFNVLIKPRSDEISISYGDMTISRLSTRVGKALSDADVRRLRGSSAAPMMRVLSPKVLQAVTVNDKKALLVGLDISMERRAKRKWWILDAGNWPKKGSEVILGEEVAKNLDVEAGDELALSGRQFRVAGILLRNGSQDDSVIFADMDAVRRSFDLGDKVSLIEIAADRSENVGQIAGVSRQNVEGATVSTSTRSVEYKKGAMGLIVKFGGAVVFVAGFISLLIVFTTMASSVNERRGEIGVFRAVGFRQRNVAAIILTEALLLSLGGAASGYVVGLIIAKIFQAVSRSGALPISVDLGLLFVSIGMSVVIAMLASILPAYRAANLDPVEALKSL